MVPHEEYGTPRFTFYDDMVGAYSYSHLQQHCHMPQFAKQFNGIEEHYVIFYAKFVIDDQVGSRIINLFWNIFSINK